MQHFTRKEFRGWYDQMSPRLVTMLDVFRFVIKNPVHISLAEGAIGRELGRHNRTKHNVDLWGEVRAIDFFVEGVETEAEARMVFNTLRWLGFTGVGVYPEWTNNKGKKQVGFHADVRHDRDMGDPATWGKINGGWVSAEQALESMRK